MGRGVRRLGWELARVSSYRWQDTQEASSSKSSMSGQWKVKGLARREGQGWVWGGQTVEKESPEGGRLPASTGGPRTGEDRARPARQAWSRGAEPRKMRATELGLNLNRMRRKRRDGPGGPGAFEGRQQRQKAGRTQGRGRPRTYDVPGTPWPLHRQPLQNHIPGADRTLGSAFRGDWWGGGPHWQSTGRHWTVCSRHVRSMPDGGTRTSFHRQEGALGAL